MMRFSSFAARRVVALAMAALAMSSLGGCSAPDSGESTPEPNHTRATASAAGDQTAGRRFGGAELPMPAGIIVADPQRNSTRSAFFGDLHVHTDYSFDAFAFGTMATPYDAYRYALGEPLKHPGGFDVQLRMPLDFYAVTDHAMFLGAVKAAADTSTPFSALPHVAGLHDLNAAENLNRASVPRRIEAFSTFLPETMAGIGSGKIDAEMLNDIARDAWADIIVAAEQFNQPGKFTTFVAYEYTSTTDERGNLHRNVIFQGADKLPAMPFSRFHSQDPEGLWDWMDGLRNQGIEALAIPHNSNGSNGAMFAMVDWAGSPFDDRYTRKRIRNEPLVEITQVKGTSETHPALSDNDEWASFEIMPYRIATTLPSEPNGSYARQALLNGLALAERGLSNAYQFGFVGASDTHTGAASLDEDNYFSKAGLLDATSALRGSVPIDATGRALIESSGRARIEQHNDQAYVAGAYDTWGASGLTGVWAEQNSRAALYAAFRRKETFATSGPRMTVRLFAGTEFAAATNPDLELGTTDDIAAAYTTGVSMGSELPLTGTRAPIFLAAATRDPNTAPLQRLQIIKGWTVNGEHNEQVFDIACSDGGVVDSQSHRCPDNGARVNLTDCSVSANRGAAQLQARWQDPQFDPEQRAFYYVRALENPTCRWSTWDAIRAGVTPREDLPASIQERVWSSPIWLIPQS